MERSASKTTQAREGKIILVRDIIVMRGRVRDGERERVENVAGRRCCCRICSTVGPPLSLFSRARMQRVASCNQLDSIDLVCVCVCVALVCEGEGE